MSDLLSLLHGEDPLATDARRRCQEEAWEREIERRREEIRQSREA